MKKQHRNQRILDRRLAHELSDEEMQAVAAGHDTGGTFTRSGTPVIWDDCKDEDAV